jgi:hypothetical protein
MACMWHAWRATLTLCGCSALQCSDRNMVLPCKQCSRRTRSVTTSTVNLDLHGSSTGAPRARSTDSTPPCLWSPKGIQCKLHAAVGSTTWCAFRVDVESFVHACCVSGVRCSCCNQVTCLVAIQSWSVASLSMMTAHALKTLRTSLLVVQRCLVAGDRT